MKAKKLLALVLSLTFIFSVFSINVFATVDDTDGGSRVYGDSRYETAIEIADMLKLVANGDEDFKTIIVAYGRNYADALAGSYLATLTDAPILLVNTDKNNKNDSSSMKLVSKYINKNLAKGGKIYVLGGSTVISDEFVNSLKTSDRTVKRLAGATRYETNIAILNECLKYEKNPTEILVCDAYGFADALSCSSLGMPILLVDKQGQKLTDVQKNYLKKLDLNKAYIIGGTAAVPRIIETAMSNYCVTSRIYGQNRYETSVKIANKFFADEPQVVITAYGHDFPDGLCGGPLAHSCEAPLILVYNDSGEKGTNLYNALSYFTDNIVVYNMILGGTKAITENTRETLDYYVDIDYYNNDYGDTWALDETGSIILATFSGCYYDYNDEAQYLEATIFLLNNGEIGIRLFDEGTNRVTNNSSEYVNYSINVIDEFNSDYEIPGFIPAEDDVLWIDSDYTDIFRASLESGSAYIEISNDGFTHDYRFFFAYTDNLTNF